MLFITNRVLAEGAMTVPGRKVTFDLTDNSAPQGVFYCERKKANSYAELGSQKFLEQLRASQCKEILIFVHGFSNLPEDAVFQRAEQLQTLLNGVKKNWMEVVPLVWPCRDSNFTPDTRTLENYFSDQLAADASGYAFARVLQRLQDWQQQNWNDSQNPCLKRINVLAHSMGNRVLRQSLQIWSQEVLRQPPPLILRNVFLVSADIVNESLEFGRDGQCISQAAANVTVYYAEGDMALRASKGANVANGVASRRLGHSGPENWERTPANVMAVDCSAVGTAYDPPVGHTYFLRTSDKPTAKPGKVFLDIVDRLLGPAGQGRLLAGGPRLVSV